MIYFPEIQTSLRNLFLANIVQVLAFGKSEISEFIYIRIFSASSGGHKGKRHIGSFTPDRERSHVWCETVYFIIHLLLTFCFHQTNVSSPSF